MLLYLFISHISDELILRKEQTYGKWSIQSTLEKLLHELCMFYSAPRNSQWSYCPRWSLAVLGVFQNADSITNHAPMLRILHSSRKKKKVIKKSAKTWKIYGKKGTDWTMEKSPLIPTSSRAKDPYRHCYGDVHVTCTLGLANSAAEALTKPLCWSCWCYMSPKF